MIGLQNVKGHICRGVKRTGIMCRDIDYRQLSYSRRIKRCFHVKIMTKGRVILRPRRTSYRQEAQEKDMDTFAHVLITQLIPIYCMKKAIP